MPSCRIYLCKMSRLFICSSVSYLFVFDPAKSRKSSKVAFLLRTSMSDCLMAEVGSLIATIDTGSTSSLPSMWS